MATVNTIDLRSPKVVDKGASGDVVPAAEVSLLPDIVKQALRRTGWSDGAPLPRGLLNAVYPPKGAPKPTPKAKVVKKPVTLPVPERVPEPVAVPAPAHVPPELAKLLDPGILTMEAGTADTAVSPAVKESAPAAVPAGVEALPKPRCSRCGHDQSIIDDVEVTREDRLSFLQSILGGIRFKKRVPMFGGKLTAVFRTLTAKEVDLSFTQLAYDARHGAVTGDELQYFRTLADYRLVMSLESLRNDVGVTVEVPEIFSDEFEVTNLPEGATKLMPASSWLYDNALKTDQLRRVVGAEFFRFQRLVEKLEARASDPNFWEATETQP